MIELVLFLFFAFFLILIINILYTKKNLKKINTKSNYTIQFNSNFLITDSEILNLINEILAKKNSKLNMEHDLFEIGYLDSMTMIQLATELEKKFSIEIDSLDITIENFRSAIQIKKLLIEKYKCKEISNN